MSRRLRIAALAILVASSGLVSVGELSGAQASEPIRYYLAAPLSQAGPEGPEINVYRFNNLNEGDSCADDGAEDDNFGHIITGDCGISVGDAFGGSTISNATSTPTFGGTRTSYAQTTNAEGLNNTMVFTMNENIEADRNKSYFAIWWSSVSDDNVPNTITLLDGTTEIFTISAPAILDLLGEPPASDADMKNTGTLPTVGGGSHFKSSYFGHPAGHTDPGDGVPATRSTIQPEEPFVRLHVLLPEGMTYDSVRLNGNGFEFDNLTMWTFLPSVDDSWVQLPVEDTGSEDTSQTAQSRAADDSFVPGIALTPSFGVGDVACGSSVFVEGLGLRESSVYRLESTPDSVSFQGDTGPESSFAHTLGMPGALTPGQHSLTLAALSDTGEALQLVRTFSVDNNCVVLSLDAGVARGGASALAPTGVQTDSLWLAPFAALLAIGALTLGAPRIRRSLTAKDRPAA